MLGFFLSGSKEEIGTDSLSSSSRGLDSHDYPQSASFDDVLKAQKHPHQYLLLASTHLSLYIGQTVVSSAEESLFLDRYREVEEEDTSFFSFFGGGRTEEEGKEKKETTPKKRVILYGKNARDASPNEKKKELIRRGMSPTDIYVYRGGLSEWILLQDIYGEDKFTTSQKVHDLLEFL
jgi:hypothetical protein